ncbi:hypothetical protein QE152_g7779 [Popillia japonica]|uniref:Uncharacterized protein n=1 Tax=Popillia japonica TaxID=7064 RepID=A0AAW1MCJ1_POPJA
MLAAIDQHQEFKINILDSITLLSKSSEYVTSKTADNNLDTWEELTEVEIADKVLANNIEEIMEEEEDPQIDNTDIEFEPPTILQAMQAVETMRFATFGNSDFNDLMRDVVSIEKRLNRHFLKISWIKDRSKLGIF